MGSSMVMTCRALWVLMMSTMDARVVLLPLPTVPVTRIRPRVRMARSSTTVGRPSSSMPRISTGTWRKTMATLPRCT